MLFSYLISFELLDRMAKTSPFIPYELGKYLLVLMGIIGLIKVGVSNTKGLVMALLVTPAIFYDFSKQRVFFDIINYYLAPLAVGLGIAFSNRYKVNIHEFNRILKMVWFGCLSSLVFTYVKTPDFEEIEFVLGANFETTAGHSSNQVSTVLGLGMFLSFYSLFKNINFSGVRFLDILVFIGFTFQGLLSFSRGGMMVGVFGILMITLAQKGNNKTNRNLTVKRNKKTLTGLILLMLIYGVFEIANNISGGNLLLRYQGETAGTLSGTKEITVNHFVTGRLNIFEQDIALWNEHLTTGVGCGVSRYLRDTDRVGVASHVELSRLLADHGILGLIFATLFFIIIPYESWKSNAKSSNQILLMTLILFAIITTFHAAMRTFVTPLFMILGSITITESRINTPIVNVKSN
jgi:O-antigen ligase